jgi:hypothetical protein
MPTSPSDNLCRTIYSEGHCRVRDQPDNKKMNEATMPAPRPSRRYRSPCDPFSPQGRALSQPTPQVTPHSQPRGECSFSAFRPSGESRTFSALPAPVAPPAGTVTPTPSVPQILTLFNATSHSLTLFFFLPRMRLEFLLILFDWSPLPCDDSKRLCRPLTTTILSAS